MIFKYKYYNKVSNKLAVLLDLHRRRQNSGMAAQLMYDLGYLKVAVARHDKFIVGWAGFSLRKRADTHEISVFVDPELRKEGIATALLDVLLSKLPKSAREKSVDYQSKPRWIGRMYEKAFFKHNFDVE